CSSLMWCVRSRTPYPCALCPYTTRFRSLEVLLERANIRQMWLVFIDQSGCLGGPLMPMNDYPVDPAEFVEADDLGVVTHAPLLIDRKSTRLNSSHVKISYAVFCLKKSLQ